MRERSGDLLLLLVPVPVTLFGPFRFVNVGLCACPSGLELKFVDVGGTALVAAGADPPPYDTVRFVGPEDGVENPAIPPLFSTMLVRGGGVCGLHGISSTSAPSTEDDVLGRPAGKLGPSNRSSSSITSPSSLGGRLFFLSRRRSRGTVCDGDAG